MSNININKNMLDIMQQENLKLQSGSEIIIENPHIRVLEDLKRRNKDNGSVIAGEYFVGKYTYDETFKMINDYKKAFLSLDGNNSHSITVSSPAVISSVNAFYGAIDANKIVNSVGPGFLFAFPEKYMKEFESETLFIHEAFLNEAFINRLAASGVKNVVVTSTTDYMNPMVKEYAIKNGLVNKENFLDSYVKSGKKLPQGMQFIKLEEFAKTGAKIKEDVEFPYQEKQIAARFLTGATTSQIPKAVELYADGLNKMAQIYDKTWFDFKPGDRNTVFIPLFYATGAIHGVHAGLFSGLTNIYKPKYDRFAFAKDLMDSKAKIALVAPSHLATLVDSNLPDDSLNHVKYIFIGGEAIMPAQMEKFREASKRLGIEYILNGYGMTETGSMSGISDKVALSLDDVTIVPAPGVKYRIVDPITREELCDNQRGILEKWTPCACKDYTDPEKTKHLFTADGWVNTGDVAIRYSNGRYRVFGRETDYFTNNEKKYAMFDIEEEVIKHPGIAEAEVIKFDLNGQEYPAIIVVLKQEYQDKMPDILEYISHLTTPGLEYLIGTRFIDKFKTNPVTAKRDYLSLPEEKDGYYIFDNKNNIFYQTNLIGDNEANRFVISSNDLKIFASEKAKILMKK